MLGQNYWSHIAHSGVPQSDHLRDYPIISPSPTGHRFPPPKNSRGRSFITRADCAANSELLNSWRIDIKSPKEQMGLLLACKIKLFAFSLFSTQPSIVLTTIPQSSIRRSLRRPLSIKGSTPMQNCTNFEIDDEEGLKPQERNRDVCIESYLSEPRYPWIKLCNSNNFLWHQFSLAH